MSRRLWPLVIFAVLVGCGDAGSVGDTTTVPEAAPATEYPVEVAGVTVPARPQRILSGSAAHTEILFAMGAGSQVAAVDLWSDFPPEVANLPRFDAFNASVEAMAALDPDLVIISFDPGGVVDGLGALGVPVLVLDAPADLEGAFAQYAEIGVAVDRVGEAETLVASMRAEIDGIVASLPPTAQGLTYFHELEATLFTVTSNTFIGHLYGLLGMTSIADGTAGGDYLQLSAEVIFDADPDFIFLADALCCGESKETVAARPGWASLTAVAEGRVIEIDESTSSRWGPRMVDFLRSVAAAVAEVTP
jgi:iron complex transport system substrate-binding protein